VRILGSNVREISALQWCAMLTAFLIPCFRKMVALGIALMVLACIAETMKQGRKLSLRLNASAWLMLSLFALHIVGLNFAESIDQGMKEIEIKLSYFIFPLLLFFGFAMKHTPKKRIAAAFVIGCLLRIPISLADAWVLYAETGNLKAWSYEMLSAPYHPSYMALYQGCSLLLMLCYFYNEQLTRGRQTLLLVAMSCTLIYISMLASRAGLISAVIFIVVAGLLFWQSATNRLERIFLTGACLVVLVASSALLPGTSQRIEALNISAERAPKVTAAPAPANKSSVAMRKVTWEGAWEVLMHHPMGVGTGDAEKALVNEYLRRNEEGAATKKLNAHNQILQLGVEFGWLGILLLLGLFVALCLSAYRQKQWIMLAMVSVLILNCLVESMMEVQAGIVFFAYLTILIGPPAPVRLKDELS
jgi:O-antigen ligase